jgi:hypothetical protein
LAFVPMICVGPHDHRNRGRGEGGQFELLVEVGVTLYSNRFFRTFGAASKPLRSANPLSIRE